MRSKTTMLAGLHASMDPKENSVCMCQSMPIASEIGWSGTCKRSRHGFQPLDQSVEAYVETVELRLRGSPGLSVAHAKYL